jgi:hypothetical protein
MHDATLKQDLSKLWSTFAPEWVGNMPARETLTFNDLVDLQAVGYQDLRFAIPRQMGALGKWMAAHTPGKVLP